MTEDKPIIHPPLSMKTKSLKELAKVILSGANPQRGAGYLNYIVLENKTIYFTMHMGMGYYNLRSLPIILWTEEEKPPTGGFLRYRTSPKEELVFATDGSDPKWATLPLVEYEEIPEEFKVFE